MSERPEIIAGFLRHSGWREATRVPLAADASFRRYERLTDGARQALMMDAPPPQEDVRPYVTIARHLCDLGYSAPRVLAEDIEAGLLLLEDFGDDTFTRLLASGADEIELYRLATDLLIDLHRRPVEAAVPPGLPAYDDEKLIDEAALLIEWYVAAVHGGPLPDGTAQEYRDLWRFALRTARQVPDSLVLRDYHVDNLMRLPGRDGIKACGLLDFQDAVRGPVTYDFVSLIEDARRDIVGDIVAEMRGRYLEAFPALDRDAFDGSVAVLGAQRHAKVIGIFIRLCRRDGKPVYLDHISRVWRLLERSCEHPALGAIRHWLDAHIPPETRVIPPMPS
jgi:aminoglycoside/choline kinase family phosphotransferase